MRYGDDWKQEKQLEESEHKQRIVIRVVPAGQTEIEICFITEEDNA